MSDSHKTPRDPKCHPLERKVDWATGSTTLLETLRGTGGFLLLRRDSRKTEKNAIEEYTVQLFISADLESFKWEKPADEEWRLIDVPRGFSINNGDALVGAFVGTEAGGIIVHGRP
ncbi:hypothetical protein BH11MYX4_BH11MYX4_25070 [soil metagenome]